VERFADVPIGTLKHRSECDVNGVVRVDFHQQRPVVGDELAAAAQERRDASADTDVSVQKQDRTPMTGLGDRREDGAFQCPGSAAARMPNRFKARIDAEGAQSERLGRCQQAPGAAADVEHGTVQAP
jgi:hypothetical protein